VNAAERRTARPRGRPAGTHSRMPLSVRLHRARERRTALRLDVADIDYLAPLVDRYAHLERFVEAFRSAMRSNAWRGGVALRAAEFMLDEAERTNDAGK
jgi:hypothetical protein